jgi:hypothetical protein
MTSDSIWPWAIKTKPVENGPGGYRKTGGDWKRFLVAVSHNNPYSLEDDQMGSYSRSRLNH